MVVFTVEIPRVVKDKAKVAAAMRGSSLKKFARDALMSEVKKVMENGKEKEISE